MKISQLTDTQIKEYCGLTEDVQMLDIYKAAAKAFISGYTGLSASEIDSHEDLTIAYCALINDMSQSREYTISRDTLNPCVQTILGMYSKNNIG